MVKTLRGPGIPLSEAPLSPIDRCAILALSWWQLSVKRANAATTADLSTPTIRSSHFLLALSALHDLPVTDPLYVPRAKNTSMPFSLVRVLDVMNKILMYLKQAYNLDPTMVATNGGAAMQCIFPLVSLPRRQYLNGDLPKWRL